LLRVLARWRIRSGLLAVAIVAALVSAGIALAADPPPTPVITGEPVVGETLTASGATIFKWQRCDPSTDPCDADAGQNASGWENIFTSQSDPSTYTLTLADEGMLIRVLGKDTVEGTKFGPSGVVGPVASPPPPPPPPEEEPAAPPPPPPEGEPVGPGGPPPAPGEETLGPLFQRTANLEPLQGTVLIKLPGSNEFVEIQEVTTVPMGTKVDVSDGHVLLVTQKKPSGGLQSIELWAGAFVLQQKRKNNITVMTLASSFASAAQSRAGEEIASLRKRKKRRLWGRGDCRCRHRGKNSSGTSRGTWWLTAERRKGTLTKVKKGKVVVRDFKRRKKVLVKAGEKYLAHR
jgi:hypothetical protein